MKKENLFNRWLDHSLSDDERAELQNDERFRDYETITQAAQYFRAAEFDTSSSFDRLHQRKTQKTAKFIPWPKIVASIAAILVLGFLVNNLLFSGVMTHTTGIGQEIAFSLPDNSNVILSAGSTISYSNKNWADNRVLKLEGEAFFKVAKGNTFSVETSAGEVTVTGTEFNVAQRADYFVVSCFEGSVRVSIAGQPAYDLAVGDLLRVVAGKLRIDKTTSTQPSWVENKSVFKSTPLYIILEELQRQYQVNIDAANLDKNVIFTGSFTHEDLETAIQAITIPLGLKYTIQGANVILEKNNE